MALIKCNECGKEMSDHAKQCPNCGKEVNFNNMKNRKMNEKLEKILKLCKQYWYILVILIVLIIIILVIVFSNNGLAGTYEYEYEYYGETHRQYLILNSDKTCFFDEIPCTWHVVDDLLYLTAVDFEKYPGPAALKIRGNTLVSLDDDVLIKIK